MRPRCCLVAEPIAHADLGERGNCCRIRKPHAQVAIAVKLWSVDPQRVVSAQDPVSEVRAEGKRMPALTVSRRRTCPGGYAVSRTLARKPVRAVRQSRAAIDLQQVLTTLAIGWRRRKRVRQQPI